jgi:hypothetical protein
MNIKSKYSIDEEFIRETYDTEQLEMMEEYETHTLVSDLVEYSNELAEEILKLRKEVNRYDQALQSKRNMDHYRPPYDDLYSDIFRDFSEHKVYEKFKDELDKMFG